VTRSAFLSSPRYGAVVIHRRDLLATSFITRASLALGLLFGAAACERSQPPPAADASVVEPANQADPDDAGPLTLDRLEDGDGAKASGKQLMALPLGLHRLDDTAEPEPTHAVIGVHGYASEGYEWVYPLKTLGRDAKSRVFLYRWDFNQCPEPMAAALGQAIEGLLAAEPELASIQVIAHSYGGVVTALAASRHRGRVPLVADLVASPLAGHRGISRECSYTGATAPPAAAPVTLRQWRTQHELDTAFAEIDPDPQVVELPGEVTVLPESYRGHRLGHNWSISWVVDHLAGGAPP
jgi:pimeloyl-ACP methyl ester carboxylesterase